MKNERKKAANFVTSPVEREQLKVWRRVREIIHGDIMFAMTHPFVVEYGDLFSSIGRFVAADALAADEEVAAVAPTTF